MKYFFYIVFALFTFSVFAQENETEFKKDTIRRSLREGPKENPKAPHNWYKLYTLKKDTILVDTSLTIRSEYKHNFLRKDNFGLLPFANDGHTYTILDFGAQKINSNPNFGFRGKYFNYLTADEIYYYQVPTPLTELYFKTVLEQGQNIDAFITLNTSKNLNFSVAYKGLRSLGKYLNSLSSTGNFRFTTSYQTTNKRYGVNLHFASQDFTNQENGGLLNAADFSSGNSQFLQRARMNILLNDAKTIFEGKRFFVNHFFRINSKDNANNVFLEHEFIYEKKSFGFEKGSNTLYFGAAYENQNYSDQTNSAMLYNKLIAAFSNTKFGKFNVFVDDNRFNYFYDRIVIENNQVKVPSKNEFSLQSFGGKYFYLKGKVRGEALFSKGLSKQTFSTLDISAKYTFDDKNFLSAQYVNLSKVPDLNHSMYQSDFVAYNWFNNFKNEKINSLKFNATTQWLSAEAQFTVLNDHIYFSNDDTTDVTLLTTPKQYAGTINYMSVKAQKEFKFRKWALDNTVLFQQVAQEDAILNVPKLVTRNTLYFSDYLFKKALFLQTGVTFQYFTAYHANGYNPLLSDFYTQNKTKIGDYPMMDFFVNGRIRQTRIFLKAEHFNSSFTGYKYYAAPNHPYKDFVVRFGIAWNFFQ